MKDFLFPDRLGRLGFFARSVVFAVFQYTLMAQIDNGESIPWSYVLLILSIIYTSLAIFLPRIRDCGVNRWTVVLTFVPYISGLFALYLLFRPTEFTTIFDSLDDEEEESEAT